MKFVRYNNISIYVDFVVEIEGRHVRVKWSTEDGILDTNLVDVFFDVTDTEFEAIDEAFHDLMPTFSLNMEEYEDA